MFFSVFRFSFSLIDLGFLFGFGFLCSLGFDVSFSFCLIDLGFLFGFGFDCCLGFDACCYG